MECVRLRVKDVDFGRNEILIRDGKGAKDRVTMLPAALAGPLQAHLARRRVIYEDDLRDGKAAVWLPDALAKKYPHAPTEWGWQYVFCSGSYPVDPRSGVVRRHHIDEKLLQRAMKKAVAAAGIAKPATPHTLRHYPRFAIRPACAFGRCRGVIGSNHDAATSWPARALAAVFRHLRARALRP